MPEDDKRLRTMFLTYEADSDSADTLMIVLGSVAENFKGVEVVEFQDDTVFAEGQDPRETLHELMTAGRLNESQQAALEEFTERLNAWDGGESP